MIKHGCGFWAGEVKNKALLMELHRIWHRMGCVRRAIRWCSRWDLKVGRDRETMQVNYGKLIQEWWILVTKEQAIEEELLE